MITPCSQLDLGQRAVLESIARGAALPDILDAIVLLIEQQAPGMLCSILLLEEGKRLRHGSAPHVPAAYTAAIDGREIGPREGSCGAAAFTRERVVVDDIATHPFWKDYRQYAIPYGLLACWSTPIFDPQGAVLGTFAMYYSAKRSPEPHELEWVDIATHLASIAILRHRTEAELKTSERRARELARLHSVASSINKVLARVSESQHVYDLACEMAVQSGLARLAWVGLLDDTHTRLNVVAQCGDSPLSEMRVVELNDERVRGGLLSRALAAGEHVVARDLNEEVPAHWRPLLDELGLRSGAVFLLKDRERPFGVFTLYASSPDYFRAEELQVLTALAADISFGIESSRNELERQRMEEGLRASENIRAVIYDSVGDGIFYLQAEHDGRYRFVSINRAFREIFGVTEERVIGRYLHDLLPDTMRAVVLGHYRRACETRSGVTWEQLIESRIGERHAELTVTPLFDASGRCTNFVGTVHDVTARVRAEAERAKLVSQLNQAQRMQALGTLAGGIAHDFNNILAAISGNAGLALQEPVEATARTHLLEIQKASTRAIGLVRLILTFSRHAPPKREVVEPRAIVREALDLLRATVPTTTRLETHFAENAPTIEGDATQLHQLIMNLATNAAHALPASGGTIRVHLDEFVMDDASAVAELESGRYLRIRISDDGCGMDEATLKRAFDPFFTTRQPGEGTGLGLSVVHGIVQSHRGTVDIHSGKGEGTTVTVYLPASTQAAEVVAQASATGRGERIMYVDDEEALVFLMERALTKRGYLVSGFSDPLAALQAFRAEPNRFDVIVTDVSMPGMSGHQLVTELRQARSDVPVIMTSGYIRPEDLQSAERLNINQLVYKSDTIQELGDVVAREVAALAHRRARR